MWLPALTASLMEGGRHIKNITKKSLCLYLFTPFGLSNVIQMFERMMDRTTDGLEGVFA
jgi:hypothetical protein